MKEIIKDVLYLIAASGQDNKADKDKYTGLYGNLVKEEYQELLNAENDTERLDAICDLIHVTAGLAIVYGYDLDGAWEEVQRSNRSKVVDGKVVKSSTGKILKPGTFFHPELDKFI